MQADGGGGGHVQRFFAAGLGDADVGAGLAGERGADALAFVTHEPDTGPGQGGAVQPCYWLQASLIVFLIFRFLMVGLMNQYNSRKLLLVMCSLGVALSLFAMVSVNILGVLAIISLSACISLLFPTIYWK